MLVVVRAAGPLYHSLSRHSQCRPHHHHNQSLIVILLCWLLKMGNRWQIQIPKFKSQSWNNF